MNRPARWSSVHGSPHVYRFAQVFLGLALAAWIASVPAQAASEEGVRETKEEKNRARGGEGEQAAPLTRPPVPIYPPYAPSMKDKNQEAFHDYVVDFEAAYAKAEPLFPVDEFTKHDYEACAKCAAEMEKGAQQIQKVHDDRLRQFSIEFHHQLEQLTATLGQLRAALKGHCRADIFTYWAELKLLRDTLAMTPHWQDETTVWPPKPPPEKKDEKKE